jgi:L-threonylcarbamoyladenylate synthase
MQYSGLMAVLQISDESIRQAAAVIARGDLAAFPTETVYGLGGDAYKPAAMAKIFEAKGRPRFDPLIVHMAAVETLEHISDLSPLNNIMRNNLDVLIKQFWPGPLTLILPKKDIIPDLVTSGLPTVAVRLPAHDTARKLIALSTGAVAAPSANPFGYLSPTRAEHVADALGAKVDIILDGGPTQFGLESTVLDMSCGQPRLLRPGAIPRESIEAVIGPLEERDLPRSFTEESENPIKTPCNSVVNSPGMLKSHYAPRIPLQAHDLEGMPSMADAAVLFFDGASRDAWLKKEPKAAVSAVLSEAGDMREAATRLFETLHEMERQKISIIHAQFAPEQGLGRAINDRLRRAASRL